MSVPQRIISIVWLAVHIALIPFLLTRIPAFMSLSSGKQNFAWYVISTLGLVIINFTFLRRDFDTMLDSVGKMFFEILQCYIIILAFDMILSGLLSLYVSISGAELTFANQNNQNIVEQSQQDYGMVKASAIFLAPIAEELMFRGGVFGTLRKWNRVVAYVVTIVAFSVYHVWSYAISDPTYWIYALQYVPISFILCRCYERTNSIWGNILFHMSWNAVTLLFLNALA